ncbi:hypothetical protein [Kitasatospora paranensis]|uniref:Uncharacterized protein n=1 Tax=Kitasatospora paranensis TaxID=258053 RepID=A0ABW2G0Y7_9ACTN
MSADDPAVPALTYLKAAPAPWSAWDIPGRRDDRRLRSFFCRFLHPNAGLDLAEEKRSLARDRSYARQLRAALEHLLEQQPATLGTWQSVTRHDIHFCSEGELYGHLLDLHAFLFGDRPTPPADPIPTGRPRPRTGPAGTAAPGSPRARQPAIAVGRIPRAGAALPEQDRPRPDPQYRPIALRRD